VEQADSFAAERHVTASTCQPTPTLLQLQGRRATPAAQRDDHATTSSAQSASLLGVVVGGGGSEDELRQLMDSIADIERDVRAMAAALLQTTHDAPATTASDAPSSRGSATPANSSAFDALADSSSDRRRQSPHGVGGPVEHVVGGAERTAGAGAAAVAVLLPSTERSVTANDSAAPQMGNEQTTHEQRTSQLQTTHVDATQRHASGAVAVPRRTSCALSGGKPGRVVVLPHTNTYHHQHGYQGHGRLADYSKYAAVAPPPTASRLPYGLNTKYADAANQAQTTHYTGTTQAQSQASDGKRARRTTENPTAGGTSSSEHKDHPRAAAETSERGQASRTPAQLSGGIQQIIRQLESLSSTAAAGHAPPVRRHLQALPPIAPLPRSAGPSALDRSVVEITSKQTQTSATSSTAGQHAPHTAQRGPPTANAAIPLPAPTTVTASTTATQYVAIGANTSTQTQTSARSSAAAETAHGPHTAQHGPPIANAAIPLPAPTTTPAAAATDTASTTPAQYVAIGANSSKQTQTSARSSAAAAQTVDGPHTAQQRPHSEDKTTSMSMSTSTSGVTVKSRSLDSTQQQQQQQAAAGTSARSNTSGPSSSVVTALLAVPQPPARTADLTTATHFIAANNTKAIPLPSPASAAVATDPALTTPTHFNSATAAAIPLPSPISEAVATDAALTTATHFNTVTTAAIPLPAPPMTAAATGVDEASEPGGQQRQDDGAGPIDNSLPPASDNSSQQ